MEFKNMIVKKWFLGTDNLIEAFGIRKRVFIDEQGVPENLEVDGYDTFAEHIVIYYSDIAVATGRLVVIDSKYFIGRVAVLKEYRNLKLGAIVVKTLIEKAFINGALEIYIHAQKDVQKFYEKLGFIAYGSEYEEAGILHINMAFKFPLRNNPNYFRHDKIF